MVASSAALETDPVPGTAPPLTTAFTRAAPGVESSDAMISPAIGWPNSGVRSASRCNFKLIVPVGNASPGARSSVPPAVKLFQPARSMTK